MTGHPVVPTINLDHLAQGRPCCSDFRSMTPGSYEHVIIYKQGKRDDMPYRIPIHEDGDDGQ